MFALASRFSTSSELDSVRPLDRGEMFAQKAIALYDMFNNLSTVDEPSLSHLQGSILLTYYCVTSAPDCRGYLGIGILCQMAYALSLHTLDKDTQETDSLCQESIRQWVVKEEKRRSWWALWELDTFTSIITRQPFAIEMQRLKVCLPVSDDAWFSCTPVSSVSISSEKPLEAWRTLENSPNQSEFAWYLVAHDYMRWAYDYYETCLASAEQLHAFLSAIKCLHITLPPNFNLSLSTGFNRTTYGQRNHVLSTHILLQNASSIITILPAGIEPRNSYGAGIEASSRNRVSYETQVQLYTQFLSEILYVVRQYWTSDTVTFCSPWMACAMIGPASIYVAKRQDSGDRRSSSLKRDLDRQLLLQVIKSFAGYWKIAHLMLDFVRMVENNPSISILTTRPSKICKVTGLVSRLQAFLPGMITE
ncbi:hypothetical protein F5884DRAFT_715833 [Xylogone sp. PMI_703]|nr:hypothetical protein F5884DRAFT_715833 [Xylogone sp. PMI_703]